MPDIKLARLPERTPVKLSISISPDLNRALSDYAELYQETYGEAATPAELVPAMLETFLAGDKAFVRQRRSPPSGR
jgi:hypothetical protein